MKKITLYSILLLVSTQIQAQTQAAQEAPIFLQNASFEGEPQDATMPVSWFECSKNTTPDILPGPWGVYTESSEGETYIGLITRGDGSSESIGQRLSAPLEPKSCYEFTMDLAHSKTYSGYNGTLKLRVWAGASRGKRDQLIKETDFIEHTDWESYKFSIFPKRTLNYIIIEAFYKEGPFSHQGNILIDNISVLKKCIGA